MNYHLIGIGGSSMAGIAQVLLAQGHSVSGSDARTTGHGAQLIPSSTDMVIYTDAITPGSAGYEELQAARQRAIPVVRRIEFIASLTGGKTSVAVAGAHGKSTTTGLIGWTLVQAQKDPTVFIGADLPVWQGSARYGRGSYVVTEACEWNRQFLALKPTALVVTTMDREHLDTYPGGAADIQQAFRAMVERVDPNGWVIANGDDELVRRTLQGSERPIHWFGHDESMEYHIRFADQTRDGLLGVSLAITGQEEESIGYFTSTLVGAHHATNIAAAIATLRSLGLPAEAIQKGIRTFPGLKRRFERYQDDALLAVIDDYAHHPTEIAATVQAARDRYSTRRLLVVFQPHLGQRTTDLFDEFVAALSGASIVLIADTYEPEGRVARSADRSSADLVDALRLRSVESRLTGSIEETEQQLSEIVQPGDVVLTLGATQIWRVAAALAGQR